jgi:hypothetical protein
MVVILETLADYAGITKTPDSWPKRCGRPGKADLLQYADAQKVLHV